jgi:sulfane dehydrogenase subunit SoxC
MDPQHLRQKATRLVRGRLTRRTALISTGAGLASTIFGRGGWSPPAVRAQEATPAAATGSNLPPNVPAWMRTPGGPATPYGERAPAEELVVRQVMDAGGSLSPLADIAGTTTPNALFYEIHYGGIPAIDPTEHRLLVHGLVEQPMLFTVDDLQRFPAVSAIHFLECSGNSFFSWQEATIGKTVTETHGLTSCAEWTGVPVATILREVGLKPGAVWMLAEGADAVGHDRSIPVEKVMRDGLLAYAANGEALRPSQGYPLRLILPGFEGNTNVKWLRRLKLG